MTDTPARIEAIEINPDDPDWDAWELWPQDPGDHVSIDDIEPVSTMVCGGENARRLAASWNACAGISTAALEAGVVDEAANALIEALDFVEVSAKGAAVEDRILAALARLGRAP